MQKLIAVVGPTAVGKSDLAVDLALEFDGEVISADSRQVYRELDIGTGKITAEEMRGVPHYLLDIKNPEEPYSAAEFKQDALKAIEDIQSRSKLPILVGGTGFFISAVINNLSFPNVAPNPSLRESLEDKSSDELYRLLKEKAPKRAETIDPKNPRRLVRALEIAIALGDVPDTKSAPSPFETFKIGLILPDEELRERIHMRLEKRIEAGMIDEAKQLRERGLSFERMNELGLEYRYLAKYLQGELSLDEMKEKLKTEIWRYAKRQKTWFRRDEQIEWFAPTEREVIFSQVESFLN